MALDSFITLEARERITHGINMLVERVTIVVRSATAAISRVFWAIRALVESFGQWVARIKLRHIQPLTPMSAVDVERLRREPIRLHLPESQREKRVGRSASLSSSWRLAAA